MKAMTRRERHQMKGKLFKIDYPTAAEIQREIEADRLAKRFKNRPTVNPIVEYVSLLHVCYHHALKAA